MSVFIHISPSMQLLIGLCSCPRTGGLRPILVVAYACLANRGVGRGMYIMRLLMRKLVIRSCIAQVRNGYSV